MEDTGMTNSQYKEMLLDELEKPSFNTGDKVDAMYEDVIITKESDQKDKSYKKH